MSGHVGSAREKEGRTGFAHPFEHLLFLESENLGKGGLDAMSARIGSSGANGSTNRDRTNYFQTVPKDALEKMIWAEVDKLGWFINTVTEPVLAKEKQVVKNEKRQSVDNRPYGIKQTLKDYPETFSEADLETTRGFLTKSSARAFEAAMAKINVLENMSAYGWPEDYVKEREAIVRGMSQRKIKQLARQYLNPDRMDWLVVGDAKTQAGRLEALGYGKVKMLN